MFAHRPSSRSLSAYHDGELAPSTALEMEQHLERCDVCRGEYARLAKVANTARHFPRFDAPVSLARAIRRRVDEELRGMVPILRDELLSCRRRPNLIPAVSLGAFLILGLLGGLDIVRPVARPGAKPAVVALESGAASRAFAGRDEHASLPRREPVAGHRCGAGQGRNAPHARFHRPERRDPQSAGDSSQWRRGDVVPHAGSCTCLRFRACAARKAGSRGALPVPLHDHRSEIQADYLDVSAAPLAPSPTFSSRSVTLRTSVWTPSG